ncbi:MAG: HK97 family phage prohead protease, partial [Cetobacterium sp.]
MAKEIKQQRMVLSKANLTESGTFTGVLSAYGNVDYGNDVVEQGAYRKTIAENPSIKMLWQHNPDEVIGVLSLKDSSEGLLVEGKLNLDDSVPRAKQAHSTMKFLQGHGLTMGLSIGYEVIKREVKDGIRYLKELRLREGSIVTEPMNQLCVVTDVKAADVEEKDFASTLEELRLWSSKYQLLHALEQSLNEVFYGETIAETAVASVDTIIDQFAETYK